MKILNIYQVMKKNSALIVMLLLFANGQQLHAQGFNWHFNSDRGEIWSVDNDNNNDNEDFIWLIDQSSWNNGDNTERMRLSKQGLKLKGILNLKPASNVGGEGEFIRNTNQASGQDYGLGFFTNSTQRLTINNVGNIGIGTTNPDKGILHIKGSFHVESEDNYQVFHVSASKALVFVGKTAYSKYLSSQTNGVIKQNNYSLWVSEGIVSEDYAVANVSTWSDYVFDKNYALPSLEKLEQYIQQYKHLPAIPSEEEVKKNGYSLTKLNNSFLKTMEELTLYTIDQHKKTMALEEQVNNQQAQIDKLAQELATLKAMILATKN
ncbi:MAG: hypothetical protein QM731_28630 [Chitinophagaceae bacterium]